MADPRGAHMEWHTRRRRLTVASIMRFPDAVAMYGSTTAFRRGRYAVVPLSGIPRGASHAIEKRAKPRRVLGPPLENGARACDRFERSHRSVYRRIPPMILGFLRANRDRIPHGGQEGGRSQLCSFLSTLCPAGRSIPKEGKREDINRRGRAISCRWDRA